LNEIQSPCLGNINLSKVSSSGTYLFESPLKHNEFISLRFSTAYINSSNRVYNEKMLYEVYLSNEQWLNLLLNINNDKGISCTINRINENGKRINTEKPFNNKDYRKKDELNIILKKLENELKQNFPTFFKIKNELKQIIYSENDIKKRYELSILLSDLKLEFQKNFTKINEIINNNLNQIFNKIDKEFENDLKENLLNFIPPEKRNDFFKLLSIPTNKNLIENKNIKKEESYNSFGLINLKRIQYKKPGHFIEDENSLNGIKIILYNSKIVYNKENQKKIIPKEKLIEYELSETQFSNFITSYNNGMGITTTTKYRKDIGEIPLENLALNKLDISIKELKKYIEQLPDMMKNEISKIEPVLRKKIGKKKLREIEIAFEQFYNFISSNIPFYVEEILKNKNKNNISKKQDIQISVLKEVNNLDLKNLEDNIKKKKNSPKLKDTILIDSKN